MQTERNDDGPPESQEVSKQIQVITQQRNDGSDLTRIVNESQLILQEPTTSKNKIGVNVPDMEDDLENTVFENSLRELFPSKPVQEFSHRPKLLKN